MGNVVLSARQPSLLDLWMSYRFDSLSLAKMASVPESTVKAMICCQSVSKDEAQKVLDTLSTLLHKNYTLSTVYVALSERGKTDGRKQE